MTQSREIAAKMPWLLRAVLAFCMISSSLAQITDSSHVKALHSVKDAVGTHTLIYSNWTGWDPCGFPGWMGVTCAERQIVKLDLAAIGLKGVLPLDIGAIGLLQSLDLSFNRELTGLIPSSIGTGLPLLTELKLQQCGFNGSIPDQLGLLPSLKHLQLAGNKLTGPIPPSLCNLTNLQWFDIGGNQVTGHIPEEIGNLRSIQHVHFWNNSLNGSIPASFGRLPNIVHLLLDNNQFEGVLPPELGNMSTLQIMRLSNNKYMQGTIPSSFANLMSLTQLELKQLGLTGTMPDLSKMPQLEVLDLSFNSLTGQISPALGTSLTKLVMIDLSDNAFTGNISSDLGSLDHLAYLDLSHNQLSGEIPTTIGRNQLEIKLVDFSSNKLSGGGAQLQFISDTAAVLLGDNPLCFEGDNKLCKNTRPVGGFAAPTPCPVACSNNNFPNPAIFGVTKQCICSSPLTVVLKLFATSFPADEFNEELANDMVNTIVGVYSNASSPFKLNAAQIQPLAWQEVGATQVNVTFRIFPPTSESAHMDFDLANDLVLKFSSGKFPYDKPTDHGIGPSVVLNVIYPTRETTGKSGLTIWEKVLIGIGAALLAVGIALLVLYALVQKKRADRATKKAKELVEGQTGGTAPSSYDNNGPQLKGAHFFSMAELAMATDNFSEERVLGSGGYGKVYKGIMPTGTEIAVKRASVDSRQGATEFKTEIEILSQVYHRNLIRLLGFCTEGGEEILVYEYMPYGNLKDAIFRTGIGREPLAFAKRLSIATGAARGIAYLHHEVVPGIIHRDIKPTNILLDKNWEAKVADFGLCKVHTNTFSLNKTGIKGTLGFMDPNYQMSHELTEKSDVYSFGVLLLELFTAVPTIQKSKSGNKHITQHVKEKLLRGGAPAIVDPALGPDYNLDALTRVIAIALQCTDNNPNVRPDMNAIVKELEEIRRLIWKVATEGTPHGSLTGHSDVESMHGGPSNFTSTDFVPTSQDSQTGVYAGNGGQTSYDPRFDLNNSNFYYSGDASMLRTGR